MVHNADFIYYQLHYGPRYLSMVLVALKTRFTSFAALCYMRKKKSEMKKKNMKKKRIYFKDKTGQK